MGFRSEEAHDTMVHACGDYRKEFWSIEGLKSQMGECLMLVDTAKRRLVD